jgi:hypothetical protein
MTATEIRREIKLTDEQIKLLWDAFPKDPALIEFQCQQALKDIHVPNKTGRWHRHDVRVYYDDGFMGSGYLLVHWDDAKQKRPPNCLDNGYCTDPHFRHEEMEWDDQPERERLLSIQKTLNEWMWSR